MSIYLYLAGSIDILNSLGSSAITKVVTMTQITQKSSIDIAQGFLFHQCHSKN